MKKQGRQVSARGRGSCNGEEAMAMARGEEITAGEAAAETPKERNVVLTTVLEM